MYGVSHKKKRLVCVVKKFDDLFDDKKLKWTTEDNTHYIKAKKPGYCKNKPMYQCLARNCPFFAYVNAEKKAYKKVEEL